MSLNCYENLHRYLHISPPNPVDTPMELGRRNQKSLETQEASELPQSCLEDSEDLEFWWWKLEPMLSTFRNGCCEKERSLIVLLFYSTSCTLRSTLQIAWRRSPQP